MASARSRKPNPEDVGLETSGVEDAKPRPTPFAGWRRLRLGKPSGAPTPFAGLGSHASAASAKAGRGARAGARARCGWRSKTAC